MTRLSADIMEVASLLLGDGRADVTITADGRAQLLPVLREMADRACKLELDLACLEAIAAEIDPQSLTRAAADAEISETDAELAARDAQEAAPRRLPPGGLRALAPDDPLLSALRDAAPDGPPGDHADDGATIAAIMQGVDDGKIIVLAMCRPRAARAGNRRPGGAT